MKYEKPNLEEMDLILEGSFLSGSSDIAWSDKPGDSQTIWD